jgi:hypothetical protein
MPYCDAARYAAGMKTTQPNQGIGSLVAGGRVVFYGEARMSSIGAMINASNVRPEVIAVWSNLGVPTPDSLITAIAEVVERIDRDEARYLGITFALWADIRIDTTIEDVSSLAREILEIPDEGCRLLGARMVVEMARRGLPYGADLADAAEIILGESHGT